jgi:RNA polymerase sigma-70 factor (ECF subfamily)
MNNERTNISQGVYPPESDIHGLIRRTLEGDSQAVAALYNLHYKMVYTYAYYRLDGNRLLAEDITEEVFIRAFRTIGTFQWKGKTFGAWLVAIARNMIVDQYRRPEALQLKESLIDSSLDPAGIVEREAIYSEMMRIVANLTSDQREVIVLRFFDDFSVAETAKIIGKSMDAVKRLQARALVVIGDKLARHKP